MTKEQGLELILAILGGTIPAAVLHLVGLAAKPWARVVLSLLPDLIGAIRRAQGKAGAPGAPKPEGVHEVR